MTIPLNFELPFEECTSCAAFAPIVTDKHYEVKDMKMVFTKKLTCKGYKFCEYVKGNVIGGNNGEKT